MVNFKENVKKHWKDYIIGILVFFLIMVSLGNLVSMGGSSFDSVGYNNFESSKSYRSNYMDDGGFAPEEEVRMKIKQANLRLESEDFDRDVKEIKSEILKTKGIVLRDEVNLNSYSNVRDLYINVKIESSKLDSFLIEIKKVGELQSFDVSVNDVTGTYADYTNRVARYEGQIESYEQMLLRANLEISEEIQIQNRIDTLEDQIFYLKGRVADIGEDVVYSEVSITMREKPTVLEEVNFFGLRDGFKLFVESVESGTQFVLVIVGFMLPFALVYGIYRVVRVPFRKKK